VFSRCAATATARAGARIASHELELHSSAPSSASVIMKASDRLGPDPDRIAGSTDAACPEKSTTTETSASPLVNPMRELDDQLNGFGARHEPGRCRAAMWLRTPRPILSRARMRPQAITARL